MLKAGIELTTLENEPAVYYATEKFCFCFWFLSLAELSSAGNR